MKKTVTSLSFSAKRMTGRLVFAMLSFVFFTATAFGQSNNFKEEIGDLSLIVWKAPAGIDAVVADENAKLAVSLGQPDLQDHDRALFLAYQRLLTYVQSAVQNSTPVDEAIYLSYEKVLTEAPADKYLASMPNGLLVTFIPGLVEALTVVQVPDASGN